ncbi:hypothetical protein [Suttonella ornithocola]|uniref:Uncharacterized protein n=1 Tax=Suttonella ornithocola TaxID=279832 RepID=A0A380MUJ0_9GAMM|nr:hypothetical protein [Suttonella ornithocola]SUO95381.1 Uncharacterised protein [Suttonella ornithocola]
MKKLLIASLAMTAFAAHADDYPAACAELEDLSAQAAEIMPEMKAQFEAVGDEATRKKMAREAYEKMSDTEKEQAKKGCEAAVPQVKQIIEMAKAQQK